MLTISEKIQKKTKSKTPSFTEKERRIIRSIAKAKIEKSKIIIFAETLPCFKAIKRTAEKTEYHITSELINLISEAQKLRRNLT